MRKPVVHLWAEDGSGTTKCCGVPVFGSLPLCDRVVFKENSDEVTCVGRITREPEEYMYAREYHLRCELFDREICSHRDKYGTAIPVTHYERIRINSNALTVRSFIMEKLLVHGLSGKLFQEGLRAVVDEGIDQWRELLERYAEVMK